jgi:hypothetical protein
MIKVIESQLISPWSSYGVGQLTNAMSKRIQHHLLVDKD